jgi:hypothetical protein
MKTCIVNVLAVFFVVSLFFYVETKAQPPEKFGDDLEQDVGCEMTAKVVEDVFREAQEESERVFIISRIAKSERKIVGWQRLSFIENRLSMVSSRPAFIVAEGRPVSTSKGVLEFWIGSKPRAIIRFKRNQRFCIDTPTR